MFQLRNFSRAAMACVLAVVFSVSFESPIICNDDFVFFNSGSVTGLLHDIYCFLQIVLYRIVVKKIGLLRPQMYRHLQTGGIHDSRKLFKDQEVQKLYEAELLFNSMKRR